MNKYVKGILIFLSAIILLVALFAGWFWWSMENNHKRAEEDGINSSKVCDTISVVTEKPSIGLGKFHKTEIDRLKFYIIRNNKIVKDTTVRYQITSADHYLYTKIPFAKFLKTDTIIVETKDNAKRYYCISGFHHYADLHYGAFGYVGGHDCRFADEDYRINGKQSNGMLLKQDGTKENILPKL